MLLSINILTENYFAYQKYDSVLKRDYKWPDSVLRLLFKGIECEHICVKRTFDIVVSIVAGVALFPLLAVVCILIKLTSEGTVLYWSERVGKNNQIFSMPKFRSMLLNTPVVATHVLDDPNSHLTSIGQFLRRFSIDELPQLYSVAKGDMSIVGPRPALFNQYDLIELRTKRGIHKLIPGITGLAQVSGRDELAIPEKVDLDFMYMTTQSLTNDLYIIWRTIFKVGRRDGVAH